MIRSRNNYFHVHLTELRLKKNSIPISIHYTVRALRPKNSFYYCTVPTGLISYKQKQVNPEEQAYLFTLNSKRTHTGMSKPIKNPTKLPDLGRKP